MCVRGDEPTRRVKLPLNAGQHAQAPALVVVCRESQTKKIRSTIQQLFLCVSDAMVDARTWNDILKLEKMPGRTTVGETGNNPELHGQQTHNYHNVHTYTLQMIRRVMGRKQDKN